MIFGIAQGIVLIILNIFEIRFLISQKKIHHSDLKILNFFFIINMNKKLDDEIKIVELNEENHSKIEDNEINIEINK